MASRFGTHDGGEFETTGVELVPESLTTVRPVTTLSVNGSV